MAHFSLLLGVMSRTSKYAIVLTLLMPGCERPPTPRSESDKGAELTDVQRSTAITTADSWSRSLRSEHAERLGSRLQRENAGNSRGGFQVIDWTNHYNRQETRCFVEIRYKHGRESI